MKIDLEKLVLLSQTDNEIDELVNIREELPTVIAELESQKVKAEKSLNSQASEITSLTADQKKKQSTLTEQNDWITERETKLKEIKTNKEYQAGVKEVAKAKKDIADLESDITRIAALIEEKTKENSELENKVKEQISQVEAELKEKQQLLGSLGSQIEEKIGTRAHSEKDITEVVLKRYKQIKARISPAVAKVERGVCMECNMNIPPQAYIELQKLKDIISCPRCFRILVAI